MGLQTLNLIKEIDILWQDVYAYLALHIEEVYGRNRGRVLEIGPFCGVIFDLYRRACGSSFFVGAFPLGMAAFFREEARKQNLTEAIGIIETDPSLSALAPGSIDLAVFRGALFFPSLFQTDFAAINRILKPGGLAFIGGGFGKQTPQTVIAPIALRSRDLNLALGKEEVTEEEIRQTLSSSGLTAQAEVTTQGGLWVIMRKQ